MNPGSLPVRNTPPRRRTGRRVAVSVRLLRWAMVGALALPLPLPFVVAQTAAQTVPQTVPQTVAPARLLTAPELHALLERVQRAAAQLDYAGIVTWQRGASLQSSRLVHVVDATGERERVEVLDGAAREFIRHNDVVQCLVPGERLVLVENRRGPRFPGLQFVPPGGGQANVQSGAGELARRYTFTQARGRQRVAARTCTQIDIRPKDALRFGQRMCVDDRSGLLLKLQTLGAHGQVIEQIAFSTLQLGQNVWREPLAPGWDTQGWKVVQTRQDEIDAEQLGWHVPLPAGFRRVAQLSRPTRSGPPLMHLVLADGLSAISVFIEPVGAASAVEGSGPSAALASSAPLVPLAQTAPAAQHAGAMGMHRVRLHDYWLTMVGEVPLSTLKNLAGQVRYAAPRPAR